MSDKIEKLEKEIKDMKEEAKAYLSYKQAILTATKSKETPLNVVEGLKFVSKYIKAKNWKMVERLGGSSGDLVAREICPICNINLVGKIDGTIKIRLINHTSKDIITKFDNEQFNRLFFNLIKNSVESIQEKIKKDSKISKNIDIEIRHRRDYININLFDTGIGFRDKKTKDLIKPYFTTKEKGTGLGLSIVDKIISDHNGSIKFLNHKNGAKIQIIIPI